MNTRVVSPYRNPTRLVDFDQLMNRFFSPVHYQTNQDEQEKMCRPSMDITETETGFELKADLPGVSNEDINVSVKENVLTIEAEVKNEAQEENAKTQTVISKERNTRGFYRSLRLGSSVDESQIKANYSNGVLTLELPKVAKAETKKIPVVAH